MMKKRERTRQGREREERRKRREKRAEKKTGLGAEYWMVKILR